jgi:hypothetical protein
MSHSRHSPADRARLAARLRERDRYADTAEALEGALEPPPSQQFEILMAACGLFDGKPALTAVTEDHLAIVLALAEFQERDFGELVSRLDEFAQSFDCTCFVEFDCRRRALTGCGAAVVGLDAQSPTKAKPKTPFSRRTMRTVELAELLGWSAALAAVIAVVVGAIVAQSRHDRLGQTRSSSNPILELTTSSPGAEREPPPPAESATASLPAHAAPLPLLDELPTEEPLPPSGTVLRMVAKPAVASLTIQALPGRHYLVRVRDWHTSEEVMSVFVHGGQSAQVSVPAGDYRIRYARGKRWYGYEDRFGPTETCFETREKVTFREHGNLARFTLKLGDPTEVVHRIREIGREQL